MTVSRSPIFTRQRKSFSSKSSRRASSPKCWNSPTACTSKAANSGPCPPPTTGWSRQVRHAFGIARDHVLAACLHHEDGRATDRLHRVPTGPLKADGDSRSHRHGRWMPSSATRSTIRPCWRLPGTRSASIPIPTWSRLQSPRGGLSIGPRELRNHPATEATHSRE